MAGSNNEFQPWLIEKLKSLNTDDCIFSSYISGILDGDESVDEKREALEDIFSEIDDSNISSHVNEIIEKWLSSQPKVENSKPSTNIDVELAKMLSAQSLATASPRQYTEEEKKIREAILSQYSQLSDNEGSDDGGTEGAAGGGGDDLVKNTNAADVAAAVREQREQARLNSQRKKDKDKEDREKQKQLREEKKEKRKTQKGERKR